VRRFFLIPFLALLAIALGIGLGAGIAYFSEPPNDQRFDSHIFRIAKQYGIDPLLVRAVVWRESKFDPDVFGAAQERGLMQVTPIAAEDWVKSEKIDGFQVDDLYDPGTNIRAGSFYLARALKRWSHTDDPIPFALAEYNAGRTHARRWVDPDRPQSAAAFKARIDFPTTREYIAVVEDKLREYRKKDYKPRWRVLWDEWTARLARVADQAESQAAPADRPL
jgi:soluble lytic murein transglycosylase